MVDLRSTRFWYVRMLRNHCSRPPLVPTPLQEPRKWLLARGRPLSFVCRRQVKIPYFFYQYPITHIFAQTIGRVISDYLEETFESKVGSNQYLTIAYIMTVNYTEAPILLKKTFQYRHPESSLQNQSKCAKNWSTISSSPNYLRGSVAACNEPSVRYFHELESCWIQFYELAGTKAWIERTLKTPLALETNLP